MKIVTKFAVWGAIGFGVGGAIGGAIMSAFDTPTIGMALSGAIGGASLGLALGSWKRVGLLAMAGTIGIVGGIMIGFGVGYFLAVEHGVLASLGDFILGAVMGAITGALLGLALKDWGGVGLLALAGAIGFGVAWQGYHDLLRGLVVHMPYVLEQATQLAIWGLIGGAFLGVALGYLEKRRAG